MVILPAYNEELTIARVIHKLDNYITRKQILVADDGSIDNTSLLARQLGVEVIRNRTNQGKGSILRKAFQTIVLHKPNIKWVFTLDADGQHSPEDIPRFVSIISTQPNLGIINGRRQYLQMPLINRISNTLTSNWCNFWLKWKIDDLQCGFRLYNVDCLKDIINYGLTSRKFDLETELLFIAWLNDMKMVQVPITTMYGKQNRKSRIKPALDTFRWIILGMRFGFKLRFFHKIWLVRRMDQ